MLIDVQQYEKTVEGNILCSVTVLDCMNLEFNLSPNECNQPTFREELRALDVDLREFSEPV